MTLPSPSFRLEPLPGYAPTIGRLVGILLYARQTTLAAVEGLSMAELDHLHDDSSNSIGALLAHIAAVERGYQCVTFEDHRGQIRWLRARLGSAATGLTRA